MKNKKINTSKKLEHLDGIWITWELQRRNTGISDSLGFHLYEINISSYKLLRYLKSIFYTFKAINISNPIFVVAQNPSIILSLFVILYSNIKNYYPIIDSHNSGIYPLEGKSKILMALSHWIQRHAILTIVTNRSLGDIVNRNGGKYFVLPDAIPKIPKNLKQKKLEGNINITCICTFKEDEPYNEILKAAYQLPDEIHIYFTGRFEGKVDPDHHQDNIHFTGFIPDHDYLELLNSSDIIIDLTLRDNCLVCGAYEALALNKPIVLSNTIVLKNYFSKGCVYTNPNHTDINQAIMEAIRNIVNLKKDIKILKIEIETQWKEKISELKCILTQIANNN